MVVFFFIPNIVVNNKFITLMSENIRILAISHSFLRKINTSVYSILKKKYGLKVKLVGPNFHLENKKKIYPDFKRDELNLDIFFQETRFNYLRLRIYKNLNKIIKNEKITHIFVDIDLISLQSLLLLINSFFKKYKICYYSNENNILNTKNIITKKIKIYLNKFFYLIFKKKILKIFCYTNQIKENLDYCGLNNKTLIIPLGFNSEKFYRNDKLINNSKFVISYFGKIEEKKGVHTMLKALLKADIKNWILQLDLFEIQNLKYFRLIKPLLKILYKQKKLRLIKCTHETIGKFMQQTDLTIVPSEWNEQYGRVIQEAAACGSIVIGSKIGAIPEILINDRFTFEAKNESAIKNKIEDIYYNFDLYRKEFDKVEEYICSNRKVENQAKIIKDVL